MKRTIVDSEVLPWVLFFTFAFVATIPMILALIYSSEYDLLYVPFASWFVFGLSGLILILDGMAFYLCRRFRREREGLIKTVKDLGAARENLAEFDEHIPVVCGHTRLNKPEFLVLVQLLFRRFPDVKYIHVNPLPGGYGGSTTVSARLQTQDEALLPRSFVLKLGDKKEMANECDKFDKYVNARLVNVPHFYIHRYAEWGDFAGIAYEFAGLGGEIRNFYQFYEGSAVLAVSELIEEIYSPLSEAWYQYGQVASVNLYHEYNLLSKRCDDIIRHVSKIVDKNDPYRANLSAAEEDLRFNLRPDFCPAPDIPWHDPVTFLWIWSTGSLTVPVHRSIVHGDLHARNVLVEIKKGGFKQVWFIDFSHTGNGLSQARIEEAGREGTLIDSDRGHTLRDFCRLEADVKFILTRLYDENDLSLAIAFERELLVCGMEMYDLQVKPPRIEALMDERFKKAWQVIREIRGQAIEYLADSDLRPYHFSLLHATLPIMYYQQDQFENEVCERQQKRYAFISAGMLCSQL
ncbi:MAG: hypothetical protein OEW09_00390 [Anaerolineae bacterium]|nr:hypothetical protein [Anaerolineae bacterium]